MGGGSSKTIETAASTAAAGEANTKIRREKTSTSREAPSCKTDIDGISTEELGIVKTTLATFSFIPKGADLLPFIRMLQKESLESGATIVSEGTEGNKLYMVSSGQLTATVDGNFLRTLNPGDSFGELALLYNTHYAMKVFVTSISGCTLFSMSGSDYRHIHVKDFSLISKYLFLLQFIIQVS
jgi:hypothetical protein